MLKCTPKNKVVARMYGSEDGYCCEGLIKVGSYPSQVCLDPYDMLGSIPEEIKMDVNMSNCSVITTEINSGGDIGLCVQDPTIGIKSECTSAGNTWNDDPATMSELTNKKLWNFQRYFLNLRYQIQQAIKQKILLNNHKIQNQQLLFLIF